MATKRWTLQVKNAAHERYRSRIQADEAEPLRQRGEQMSYRYWRVVLLPVNPERIVDTRRGMRRVGVTQW